MVTRTRVRCYCCCLDVGEGKDLDLLKKKRFKLVLLESYMIDAKEEFANEYALIALQAHTWYEGKYPLVSALSRPLIAKKLVEIAEQDRMQLQLHMVVQERK